MNSTRIEAIASSNRNIGNELQEKLYTNIALLNMKHEPSAEFKSVFKKNMFAKINKAAFLHVIHYLLTVLNPQLAKKKLVTWPTGNIIKRDNEFRTEVYQYLNELNHLYEDANLPKMMSSHLLAPGGHRFIYFMYKLSQLVLVEDLRREDPFEILNRPKQSKNSDLNEKAHSAIVTCTKEINCETQNAMAEFENIFETFKKAAEDVENEEQKIHKEMKELDRRIEIEENLLKDHELSKKGIHERLKGVEKRMKFVKKINKTFTQCKGLINHLKETNVNEVLDLEESLKRLSIGMKRQIADLPIYEISELESLLQIIEERRDEISEVGKNVQMRHEAFVESMKRSVETLKNVCEDLKY